MGKVTLFFCDICGTFDMGGSLKVDSDEIRRFAENLKKIALYNGTSKIIFSFVTSESLETVILMENELNKYISNSIVFGNHIYCKGTESVNKPYDILMTIQKMESDYEISENVYYADDCEFFHLVLKELADFECLRYKINSVVPCERGLEDVNEIIEKTFEEVSMKRILKNDL